VALSSVSNLSQSLLYTLDAVLGSTESSRAVAAIITLVRREFAKSESGNDVDRVGVGDLLVGIIGFALLQRWGRKNTNREIRDAGGEVTIWDVVILDNGTRADVIGTQTTDFTQSFSNVSENVGCSASFFSPHGDRNFDAMERSAGTGIPAQVLANGAGGDFISDEAIRLHIVQQLPPGTHVSITSHVVTSRTITVEIYDEDVAKIAAPPGTTMVEEHFHHNSNPIEAPPLPRHTIIFKSAVDHLPDTHLITENLNGCLRLKDQPKSEPIDIKIEVQTQETPVPKILHKSKFRRAMSSERLSDSDPLGSSQEGSFSKIARRMKTVPGQKSDSQQRNSLPKKNYKLAPTFGFSKSAKDMKEHNSTRLSTNRSSLAKSAPRANREAKMNKSVSGGESLVNKTLPRLPYHKMAVPHCLTPSPGIRRPNGDHDPCPDGRTNYLTTTERNSCGTFLSQTDSYSVQSIETRPGSASFNRTHVRSTSSLSLTNDDRPVSRNGDYSQKSYSLYSLAATGSETSLILAPRIRKSVYEDDSTIEALNRNGRVPGIFPDDHLVRNIRRFCRFACASYGVKALKVMGVQHSVKHIEFGGQHHHEHESFSDFTGLPPSTILLSSFVDAAGGSNAAGETGTGFPLVHYLSLDHESQTVVLTLRGTWGFEDVLTDMTCDYDDLEWQGKNWRVHKGMHASACRLLEGGGGKVMVTLRAALEEFPKYGVVFCGHSLGGGVAALLATMISEPNNNPSRPSFVTTSMFTTSRPLIMANGDQQQASKDFSIPSGRPIHVYAYGSPAVMSPFLRRATRGLITTVINGSDIVPALSLGTLHDFRSVALCFKNDMTGSKAHIRSRVWEGLRHSILNKFYVKQPPIPITAGYGIGEDGWAWSALKSLREEMTAPKLMPPGEVFVVDTMRVLQRNAFTSNSFSDGHPQLGRPATRVQFKFIRDVQALYGEVQFGSSMLGDHNPARYEASLAALSGGVVDD
jgi:hypothetical protein